MRVMQRMTVGDQTIPVEPALIDQFFRYQTARDAAFATLSDLLRTETEALAYCAANGFAVGQTRTQNLDHHQSSKAIVATVSSIAKRLCDARRIEFNPNPQTRCAWHANHKLHVTARNMDGAIPALVNPRIIWEIKEYWGNTGGGSKMSDAVYECNLVGRELREFEEQTGTKVCHIVFLDGKAQWGARKSDMKRFIDLTCQGLIDHLFIGRSIETEFHAMLAAMLDRMVTQPRA